MVINAYKNVNAKCHAYLSSNPATIWQHVMKYGAIMRSK